MLHDEEGLLSGQGLDMVLYIWCVLSRLCGCSKVLGVCEPVRYIGRHSLGLYVY